MIDVTGKIVSPGFVNTHLHAWMTAFRTIAPDTTLTHYFDWLGPSSETAQKAFTPEGIYWSALEGFLEGLNGGVTTFLDHAHAVWSPEVLEKGHEAALDSGARIWWCYEPASSVSGFEMDKQWSALAKVASAKVRTDLVPLGLSYQGLAGAKGEEFETVKRMIR